MLMHCGKVTHRSAFNPRATFDRVVRTLAVLRDSGVVSGGMADSAALRKQSHSA